MLGPFGNGLGMVLKSFWNHVGIMLKWCWSHVGVAWARTNRNIQNFPKYMYDHIFAELPTDRPGG